MVTASNGQVKAASLPELPSADSTRRDAPRRAESLAPPPAKVTEGDGKRLPRWSAQAVSAALTGGSLLHTAPLSLAACWAQHRAAATHYELWPPVRWARYAWGAFHVALKAALNALEWVTDSPPKLLTAAAVVAACWFWS
jgi:hypothetical protein